MGFLSKIKNAVSGVVSSLPGGDKIIKHSPVAQSLGLGSSGSSPGPVGQPAGQEAAGTTASRFPVTRNAGWQGERVAALRARFSRLPPPVKPSPSTPAAAVSNVVTKPEMPPDRAVRAVPTKMTNPADDDVATYARHWGDAMNNTY